MPKCLLPLLLCLSLTAQTVTPLTDQRIVELVHLGVSQAEILRMIETAPQFDFDLRPVSTDAMLKGGVSEKIIKAMAARQDGDQKDLSASNNSAATVAVQSPDNSRGSSYKLTYDGGSLSGLKVGKGVRLWLYQNHIRLVRHHADVLTLPASAIREISYGQDVHRRVGAAIGLATISFGIGALMALTKSKKHYIGLTWDSDGKKGGAAFQADKHDYRGVLAGLEGITGKKAVDSDTMTVKN